MQLFCCFTSRLVCYILLLSSITSIETDSQTCYSSFIDSVLSRSNIQFIQKTNRELSGDTSTIIGGQPYTIYSRYYLSPSNDKAAQYIYEKFQSFGLNVSYSVYSPVGKNVIARKTGTKYPNRQYLICAHFDNILFTMQDTIHGSDDNGSGLCAVLEAARLLSQYEFDYTLVFAVFDQEEIDFSGSKSFADSAFFHGDSLLGVINLDMIGYDSNNDFRLDVASNNPSSGFADVLISSCNVYQPQLLPSKTFNIYGSDQRSFWARGFICSAFHESTGDLNPNMHQITDSYYNLNIPFMHSMIKSAVAALAALAGDYIIRIEHTPLQSTPDTSSRIVEAVVKSNHTLASGTNRPRLYYRVNNSAYSFTHAYYASGDTFRFIIPGFPPASTVSYYIAVQDSAGTLVSSSPPGCRGFNPPGTVPPLRPDQYYVTANILECSGKMPLDLSAGNTIYDTIFIYESKQIEDLDVNVSINFPQDRDLGIYLIRDGYNIVLLSANNGGDFGNYVNTVFDDEADTLISSGTPPFTGHYKPEKVLSDFHNTTSYGAWILKVVNSSNVFTGEVASWCINIQYHDIIGITNHQVPLKSRLSQNYPNPFNPVTSITYELSSKDCIKLAVYDILGREVEVLQSGEKNPGKYEVTWNASAYSSGIYFYRLTGKNINETKKMLLIK